MLEPTPSLPWRPTRLLLLFAGVLLPLLLFGSLAEDVLERVAFSFDLPILHAVHRHSSPLLDALMHGASVVGSIVVLFPFALLVFAVLAWRARRRAATFWLLAVGGAALLNPACKHVFARSRPDLWVSPYPELSFSFPSGHAMNSMAVLAALIALAWHTRAKWPLLTGGALVVALVGLSRIYWGVHYPSDVLAGWAAAVAWVAGVAALYGRTLARTS